LLGQVRLRNELCMDLGEVRFDAAQGIDEGRGPGKNVITTIQLTLLVSILGIRPTLPPPARYLIFMFPSLFYLLLLKLLLFCLQEFSFLFFFLSVQECLLSRCSTTTMPSHSLKWAFTNFLLGLTLNWHPPDLHLLSS
jgi:hypothetical protein